MMSTFFWNTSRRTHESLPCGLQWRKLVKLFKKPRSSFTGMTSWCADNATVGQPTKQKRPRSATAASLRLAQAVENTEPASEEGSCVAGVFPALPGMAGHCQTGIQDKNLLPRWLAAPEGNDHRRHAIGSGHE